MAGKKWMQSVCQSLWNRPKDRPGLLCQPSYWISCFWVEEGNLFQGFRHQILMRPTAKSYCLRTPRKPEIAFEKNLFLLCTDIKIMLSYFSLNVLAGYLYSNSIWKCCRYRKCMSIFLYYQVEVWCCDLPTLHQMFWFSWLFYNSNQLQDGYREW